MTGLNGTYTKTSSRADPVLLLAAGLAIVAASGTLEVLTAGTATPVLIAAETTLNVLSSADTITGAMSQCMPKSTYNYNGKYVPSDAIPGCIRTPSINGIVSSNKCSGNGNCFNTYFNAFSSQLLLQVCIPVGDFGESGMLHLTGLNLASKDAYCEQDCSFPATGAEVNLSIPICHAHTISGQVKLNGNDLSNQEVMITQCSSHSVPCNDFYVQTNSTGDYNFFARKGYYYKVLLPSNPFTNTYCLSPTSTNNSGTSSNLNFNIYSAVFQESGLASGTQWSVNIDGITESSTSSTIVFNVSDGTYSYAISPITSYTVSPSSGTITVNSSSVTQDITFTGDYTVTFTESGLPSGTSWEVELGSNTKFGTGTSISFSAGNGQYSFNIPGFIV